MLEWRWPANSRKEHLFPTDGLVSLCGKWMFNGKGTPYVSAEPRYASECVACYRKGATC